MSSVASILEGGGPFRAGWQGAHPAVVVIVGALTLWLYLVVMVRGRHLVGSVDRFVGSILILILVLLRPVVSIAADSAAALLLLLPLMLTMRSALTEGRAPSYVGINLLLIEVGVVACAGCAGLLGGGTRVDVGGLRFLPLLRRLLPLGEERLGLPLPPLSTFRGE